MQLETFKKMTILWVNLDQQKFIVCIDVAQNFDDIQKLNHKIRSNVIHKGFYSYTAVLNVYTSYIVYQVLISILFG